MKQRVAITGLGLSTALGNDVTTFWDNLTSGRSGISRISVFDAGGLSVRIGGQVNNIDTEGLASVFAEAAGERDRKIWLGLNAALQAIKDSRLTERELAEVLLIVGVSLETFFLEDVSELAGGENTASQLRALLQDPRAPRLQTPLDRLTDIIGNHYGISGPRATNCSACAAGTQAIGEAFRRVRSGSAEVALAGASDSVLNPLAMGGFALLQILSDENELPEQACRPFDATRRGTVLGEGAAFLVLEPLERARKRGARVYAEVIGYGCSLDAYRVTDPEPEGRGAVLSMRKALADAGLAPGDMDSVNAHGTGTPKNDVVETLALKRALGPRAYEIPVTANKSMTGHLIAASGAVEAAASALTLFTGTIPPTSNLSNPDPECDLDYVPRRSRRFAGDTVLSNSFGFGGQNATLIFSRPEGPSFPSLEATAPAIGSFKGAGDTPALPV
jgi:3-oxoacyl-[acyl-carrier-protein] synthase II